MDSIAISLNKTLSFVNETRINPIPAIRTFNNNRRRIYLEIGFKKGGHFKKSFMAV